jgi:hypothetical protein
VRHVISSWSRPCRGKLQPLQALRCWYTVSRCVPACLPASPAPRNLEQLYSPDPGTATPDQVASMWQALDVFFG